jgi:uncharacterized membrane protein
MTTLLLDIHIAAGTAALLAMILPLVSRKGGTLHRRAGWVFSAGMGTVCLTALLLSTFRLATDGTWAGRNFSLLLIYVAILTSTSLWAGLLVLRARHRTGRGTWGDAAHAVLLAVAGTFAFLYGALTRQPLFLVFGAIGALNGIGGISYWRRAPRPMDWWLAHMANMLGACVTAVTAFFLAGARHIGLPGDSIALWLGPTIVGAPLIALWVRYYARRFSIGRTSPRPTLTRAESHGSAV